MEEIACTYPKSPKKIHYIGHRKSQQTPTVHVNVPSRKLIQRVLIFLSTFHRGMIHQGGLFIRFIHFEGSSFALTILAREGL